MESQSILIVHPDLFRGTCSPDAVLWGGLRTLKIKINHRHKHEEYASERDEALRTSEYSKYPSFLDEIKKLSCTEHVPSATPSHGNLASCRLCR